MTSQSRRPSRTRGGTSDVSVDERLRRVFAHVFGIQADSLKEDDSPHTVNGWDSVGHLNLIMALEGEFAIQFEIEEIPELVSFRVICERVTEAETLE